jgi:hypothetical protein
MKWVGIATTMLVSVIGALGGADLIRESDPMSWRMFLGLLAILGAQKLFGIAFKAIERGVKP